MTAVHILLNSYVGLYDFLNLPEGQWIKIIESRLPPDDGQKQPTLFPEMRGPNLENNKTRSYLQTVSSWFCSNRQFYRTAIVFYKYPRQASWFCHNRVFILCSAHLSSWNSNRHNKEIIMPVVINSRCPYHLSLHQPFTIYNFNKSSSNNNPCTSSFIPRTSSNG